MSRVLPSVFLATLLACSYARSSEPLADPTRPAGTRTPAAPRARSVLRVEGVIRGERDLAIIAGKLVRVGDRVDGARVDAILADGVRYTRDGRTYTARLPETIAPVRRNAVAPEDSR